MSKVKSLLLTVLFPLGGCNVLWGPSDQVGNWPFHSSAQRVFQLDGQDIASVGFPVKVKLLKGEGGLNWVADFGDGEVYEGSGSLKLLGITDTSKTYGFSAAIPAQFVQETQAIPSSKASVFGVINEMTTDHGLRYKAALISCGPDQTIKVCETSSNTEAWQILRELHPTVLGAVSYKDATGEAASQ
jgi:hypothetical protein